MLIASVLIGCQQSKENLDSEWQTESWEAGDWDLHDSEWETLDWDKTEEIDVDTITVDTFVTHYEKKGKKSVVVKEPIKQQQIVKQKRGKKIHAYIESIAQLCQAESKYSAKQGKKIPASIKIAQGILESSWGKSPMSKVANNHFCIKAYGWKGPVYGSVDDDWVYKGKTYRGKPNCPGCGKSPKNHNCSAKRISCSFRKYKSKWESFRDHTNLLIGGRKNKKGELVYTYKKCWNKSPVDCAYALQECGYATSKSYASNLIRLINTYKLTRYDI